MIRDLLMVHKFLIQAVNVTVLKDMVCVFGLVRVSYKSLETRAPYNVNVMCQLNLGLHKRRHSYRFPVRFHPLTRFAIPTVHAGKSLTKCRHNLRKTENKNIE